MFELTYTRIRNTIHNSHTISCSAVTLLSYKQQWAGSALLRSTRSHGTLPCYTLQGAGPAPLRPTRARDALICYTLRWDGPALLRPKGSNGKLLCYTLQRVGPALLCPTRLLGTLLGLRGCARRDRMVRRYVALLHAPLRGTRTAAPCWPAESLSLLYIAATQADILPLLYIAATQADIMPCCNGCCTAAALNLHRCPLFPPTSD